MPYPTKRTPEVVEEILQRLSDGEPLTVICRSDKKFPHPTKWLEWVRSDEELAFAYAHARDAGADAIAEEAMAIVDAEPERVVDIDADGKTSSKRIDSAAVAWAKNRAEIRLKLLAKWNPKKYGEKSAHELSGSVKTEGSLAPEQLAALTSALITKPEGE